MSQGRTIKILLALIAAGIWGLVLRPWLRMPSPSAEGVAMQAGGGTLIIVAGGKVSLWRLMSRPEGGKMLVLDDSAPLP